MEQNEIEVYVREAFQQMDLGVKHPSIQQLTGIATGETVGSDRIEVERHLSTCDQCRHQLRDFEQFRADCELPARSRSTPGSNPELHKEWREFRRRIFWRDAVASAPRWGSIAAAVVAAVGSTWFGVTALMPSVPRLLATAYQEQRRFEFRIAGGQYAPVRMERGSGSAFSSPAALLKAEAKLAEEIKSSPDDPDVARLQGEAEMLDRRPTAAVPTLQKALDFRPRDARILADLGAAFALRGDLERQPADYPKAFEYLSRSLHLQPEAPEVVFNRALVLERMMLKNEAILEWEAYLRLDASSGWAKEARDHLAKLKAAMKAREDALALFADDPNNFLALAPWEQADAEAFLRHIAMTKWLPRVNSDAPTHEATTRLAQILKEKHGNSWLSDMWRKPVEPSVEQLAKARMGNQTGVLWNLDCPQLKENHQLNPL
jgi:tetratricopeptide (TPR) repeat protein